MKTPRISFVLPLLLALHCAPNLAAQAAQDSVLIRRVDDHYNHLHTLRARYTERYTECAAHGGRSNRTRSSEYL